MTQRSSSPRTTARFGGFLCQVDIPRLIVGLNSDFLPIYDDLPEGSYDFRVAPLTFQQFEAQRPPQKPSRPEVVASERLSEVAEPREVHHPHRHQQAAPYSVHLTLPDTEQLFTPGIAPPSNQSFTP